MQIYHQSINRTDFGQSDVIIYNSIDYLKEYIEDSIEFQNKCNRRKVKVAKSRNNNFHVNRWR